MFGRVLNTPLESYFLPQICTMSLQVWTISLSQFRQVNLSGFINLLQLGEGLSQVRTGITDWSNYQKRR